MPVFAPKDLAAWTGGTWDPAAPAHIDGVSNDTRTLRPGNLYLALRGENFDGHAFLDAAAQKGASGAVVRADHCAADAPSLPLLRVADTGRALRDMAAGYRARVNPEIIAVTGSAGKSTVKEMTAQALAAKYPTAWTRGNWNNDIGLPLSLLAMDGGVCLGVFEAGTNHPGEIAPLCALMKPQWGIITNVGPVHLEHFGTVEAIAEEKGMMFRSLPAGGAAILLQENPFFDRLSAMCSCRVVSASLQGDADYRCLRWDEENQEALVEESASGERYVLRLPLPGEHNLANALLAVAAARGHSVEWERIQQAFSAYQALPMRWQELSIGGIRVINDAYNANPLSMRASLKTFAGTPVAGKKWVVLAGMLELGEGERDEHLALGAFAAAGAWAGIITVGPRGDWIAEGAARAGFDEGRVHRCANNDEAVERVAACAVTGDAVLLKASRGMRLEQVVEGLKKRGGAEHGGASDNH